MTELQIPRLIADDIHDDLLRRNMIAFLAPATYALTDEERADLEARRQAVRSVTPGWYRSLIDRDDPVARAVLDVHSPNDHLECTGCPDELGYADWPCVTVAAVADALGLPVPADLHLLARADLEGNA